MATRKILIIAASGIVLLSAAPDLARGQGGLFDSETWTRQGLKAVFGPALQRRITIDGGLDIDLGATLRVVANDIMVENVDWSSRPHMLRIGRLTFAIDLVQLVSGDVVIPEVHLEDPVLFVERSRTGEVNWQTVLRGEVIDPPPELAADVEQAAEADPGAMSVPAIRDLLIQDARISYVDHLEDVEVEARLERLAGSTGTGDEPAQLRGTGELSGLPLEIDLEAGSLGAAQGGRPAPVEVLLQVGDTELGVSGSAVDLLALRGLDLRASLESENPARLLRIVEPRPPELPSLSWSGRITRAGGTWAVRELDARVGESVLSGDARLVTAEGDAAPLIEADLQSERLVTDDFDDLIEVVRGMAPDDPEQRPAAPEGAEPSSPDDLGLPRFDISFRADEVRGPDLALENLDLNAQRPEGAAPTIRVAASGRYLSAPVNVEVEAGEPGGAGGDYPLEADVALAGTTIRLSGTIEDPMSLGGLDLRFDAESDRPEALLRLAGVDDRPELPEVAASGRLVHEAQVWRLADLALSLGRSDLSGTARFRLAGERPAVRADLAAERIVQADLEKLVALAQGLGNGPEADDEEKEPVADEPLLVVFEGSNPELNPAALPDIEADLTLTVDRFEAPEMTLREVRLAAELHDRLPRLALEAAGQYRGEPLEVLAILGAGEVTDEGAYPVTVRIDGPANQLVLEGSVREPVPLRGIDLDLEFRSTTPGPWLDLVGLPGYRPGRVLGTARLTQTDATWRLSELYAEVGESNLFGELVADLSGEVPSVEGDLTSNRLLVEDFVPEPEQPEARLAADDEPVLEGPGLEPQVLPDVRADLTLRVEYLEAEQLRLDNLALDLAIRNRLPIIDLTAEGRLQREPVRVVLRAGTEESRDGPNAAYPVELEVTGRVTRVRAAGTVAEPLVMDGLDVDVRLEGPTLDRLGEIAQLGLPPTPPYRLTSNLARDGRRWTLTGLDGRIGDSDLAGDVMIDLGAERPTLFATLRSRSLDFDDLGPLVGVAPEAEGDEAASERQERTGAIQAADRRVLPDDPIDLSELRSMDARVEFIGARVSGPNLPLEQVEVEAVLEDGRLRLEPLRFEMAQGAIEAEVELDARDRPLDGRFDIAVRNLQLNQFLKQFEVEIAELEVEREGRGTLHGRARLETRGNTIHEMAASADGRLTLVMDGGRINALLVEAAGLDVGEILALLATGGEEPDMLPIECFIGNFPIEQGVMRARPLVLKVPNDTILGTGTIDLGRETFDLALEAEPTDTSILSASTPIRIQGPWTDPSIIPTTDELIVKGVAAAGLGIVIPFIGAAIPFVEIGDGADGGCAKLLADAPEVD